MSAALSLLAAAASQPKTYATWNPADKGAGVTLSGGNLVASSSAGFRSVRATQGITSGKWYWEVLLGGSGYWFVGVSNAAQSLSLYLASPDSTGRQSNGHYWNTTGSYSDAYEFVSGQRIGLALDKGAGTLEMFNQGASLGVISNVQSGAVYPSVGFYNGTETFTANFGATALTYSPPSGFNAGVYS